MSSPCEVHIGDRVIVSDEDNARDLFAAACLVAKQGGVLALSADEMVFLSASTQISIRVPGGFAEEPTPAHIVERAARPRRLAVVNPW